MKDIFKVGVTFAWRGGWDVVEHCYVEDVDIESAIKKAKPHLPQLQQPRYVASKIEVIR